MPKTGLQWLLVMVLLLGLAYPVGAAMPGYVVIQTVSGVEVFMEDELQGVTAPGELFVLPLPPGQHVLVTRKQGYADQILDVTVESMESININLQLEPVAVQMDVLPDEPETIVVGLQTGTLELRSLPQSGGRIEINGIYYGDTNRRLRAFPVGSLQIEITRNQQSAAGTFVLDEGQTMVLLANYLLSPPQLIQLFDVEFVVENPVDNFYLEVEGEFATADVRDWSEPVRLMGPNQTVRVTNGEDYMEVEIEVDLREVTVVTVEIPPLPEIRTLPRGNLFLQPEGSALITAQVVDVEGQVVDIPVHWQMIQGEGLIDPDEGNEVTYTAVGGGVHVLRGTAQFSTTDIVVHVPYDVAGSVVDIQGRGVEGVEIVFDNYLASVFTDADGVWEKTHLIGEVRASAQKDEWLFGPGFLVLDRPSDELQFRQVDIGDAVEYDILGMPLAMRLAPGLEFPMGVQNAAAGAVDQDFWIGETPVTYEIWYAVRMWALENGYTFANVGREGSSGSNGLQPTSRRREPVTRVSWRDAVVWANALSEFRGYEPVYTSGGQVLRDALDADAVDNAVVRSTDGFRLPSSEEWELAARYQGSDPMAGALEFPSDSGDFWTPGSYASGATGDHNDVFATRDVAWFIENSGEKTQSVAMKEPNQLGLFDMSGNVLEWCFTLDETSRVRRGGAWLYNSSYLQVGVSNSYDPAGVYNHLGFRLVRTP